MAVLARRQFGDEVLRKPVRKLIDADVHSEVVQTLIHDMRETLQTNELGVGLAAPQVGESLALAVIWIEPTEHRPKVERFSLVMINPVIVRTIGRRTQLWEGCISAGSHGTADLFAKVPRYPSVELSFTDETGAQHQKVFDGLVAHVIQHEVDHLNGILFVDKVKDPKTFMTNAEYKKMLGR